MYNPTQRLMRSRTDKIIAGVAGGIGQYLAIDPVIVRLAFVALCFTGVGVLLYPVLWLAPYLTVWRVINRLRSIAEHGGMQRSKDRRETTHSVRQHLVARFLLLSLIHI